MKIWASTYRFITKDANTTTDMINACDTAADQGACTAESTAAGCLDQLADAMNPWAAERGFFNYADRPGDVDALLPAETYTRLVQVKRSWDPESLILANHSVAPATA